LPMTTRCFFFLCVLFQMIILPRHVLCPVLLLQLLCL
jgi:hypothetical protein